MNEEQILNALENTSGSFDIYLNHTAPENRQVIYNELIKNFEEVKKKTKKILVKNLEEFPEKESYDYHIIDTNHSPSEVIYTFTLNSLIQAHEYIQSVIGICEERVNRSSVPNSYSSYNLYEDESYYEEDTESTLDDEFDAPFSNQVFHAYFCIILLLDLIEGNLNDFDYSVFFIDKELMLDCIKKIANPSISLSELGFSAQAIFLYGHGNPWLAMHEISPAIMLVPLYELGERIAPKAKFAYELSTGSEFLPVPSQDGYASPKEMVYSSLKNKIITPIPLQKPKIIHERVYNLYKSRLATILHDIQHYYELEQSKAKSSFAELLEKKPCLLKNNRLVLLVFICIHEVYFNFNFYQALKKIPTVSEVKNSEFSDSQIPFFISSDLKREMRKIGINIPLLKKDGNHTRNNNFVLLAIVDLILEFSVEHEEIASIFNLQSFKSFSEVLEYIDRLSEDITDENEYTPSLKLTWEKQKNNVLKRLAQLVRNYAEQQDNLPNFSEDLSGLLSSINTRSEVADSQLRLDSLAFHFQREKIYAPTVTENEIKPNF